MNNLNSNAQTDAEINLNAHLDEDNEVEVTVPRRRIGKIGSLPENVREELNYRLADGEQGETVLRWLNELPETKEIIDADFQGKSINKQNLSEWRRGGYAEWRMRCDLVEQARDVYNTASELREREGGLPMAGDLVTVFTARYAALLNRWDGEVTEAFSDKVRVFSRIRRDLLKMQECARESLLFERKEEEREMEDKKRARKKARKFVLMPREAALRREHLAALNGDEAGERYADVLDRLDYGDHPFYPDLFAHSDDAQRHQRDVARLERRKLQAAQKGGYAEIEALINKLQADEKAIAQRAKPAPEVQKSNQPANCSQGKVGSSQGSEKPSQPTDHQASTLNHPPTESTPVKPFSETPVKAGTTTSQPGQIQPDVAASTPSLPCNGGEGRGEEAR